MRLPIKFIYISIVFVLTLVLIGLYLTFFGERLPFHAVRWKHGYPLIQVEHRWVRLLAVNDIQIERLINNAIEEWGPAYQDRFLDGFEYLLKKENTSGFLYCELKLQSAGKKKYWCTHWRYEACLQDLITTRLQTNAAMISQYNCPAAREIELNDDALTCEAIAEDLRYFQWTTLHRYAYLQKAKRPFDSMLTNLIQQTHRGLRRVDFALELQKTLALFSDIHTQVSFNDSHISFGRDEMPCSLASIRGNVVCFKPNTQQYLLEGYPYLREINGISIKSILQKVLPLVPNKNTVTYSQDILNYLLNTSFIMRLDERPYTGTAILRLQSADGNRTKLITLVCTPRKIKSSLTKPVEVSVLNNNIGYLGMRTGMFPGKSFINAIIMAMDRLEHTEGLIVDLRGNTGGKRDAIPLLIQYLIRPQTFPLVVNIAALRMDEAIRPSAEAEVLQDRLLQSEHWNGWTDQEHHNVGEIKNAFAPQMILNTKYFSDLHFMVIRRDTLSGAYYYRNRVIVLHDQGTASAAGILLSVLKGKSKITLVGTASNSDSGYAIEYQLPNSKIIYTLSSMASFLPNGNLMDTVEPDIVYSPLTDPSLPIKPTHDTLMETAWDLLRHQ